jgi:hypothetical protein
MCLQMRSLMAAVIGSEIVGSGMDFLDNLLTKDKDVRG